MKRIIKISVLTAFIAMIFSALSFAKEYKVDSAHSQVEFRVKHLSVSNVKGGFNEFNGSFNLDNNKLLGFNGEVNINTINTNNSNRDSHIKSSEYFNVDKFPKATIKLVNMEGSSGIFDLTIKGITKQVRFNVEVNGTSKNQAGTEVAGISLNGKINRKDFNIAKSTLNSVISDEVLISIDVEGFVE